MFFNKIASKPAFFKILAGLSLLLFTACSGGGGGSSGGSTSPGSGTLQSITIQAGVVSLPVGLSEQLSAMGSYSDGTTVDISPDVVWSVSDVALANVNATGLLQALAQGPVTVTVYHNGSGIMATFDLVINPAVATSITVTPANISLAQGLTQPYQAMASYSDGSSLDVTNSASWATGNAAIASISATGLATANATGATTVSATLGGVTGSTGLTVNSAALATIAVSPADGSPAGGSLAKGLTRQMKAMGSYTNGSTVDISASVAWSSAGSLTASVDANGLVSGVAAGGPVAISATLGGVTGSDTITITPAALQFITVSGASANVASGLTVQFTAMGSYSDGSTADITASVVWSTSDTALATILTSGPNTGLATGKSPGAVSIYAADPATAISGAGSLNVTAALLSSISITPANTTVAKGLTQQMTAWGTYTDGTTVDITASAAWGSSNTAIASVATSGGLATANSQGGPVTFTATLGAISGSTGFTVSAASLVSITVTPANGSVAEGLTQQMAAMGAYTDGTQTDLTASATWSSSNNGVATVVASGANAGLASGVLQGGPATITATQGGVSGSTGLTVSAAVLQSIAVTPANPVVFSGQSQQMAAMGSYTNGTTVDITASVTWSSSDNLVATVVASGANAGLATGQGATGGTATLTATLGAVNGSTQISVNPPVTLVSISVTPAAPNLPAGVAQQFTATGTYSDATTADLTASATWASSNTAAATIVAGGQATTVAVGSTNITATVSGVTGTAALTVSAETLVSITVTPTPLTLPRGLSQQMTATGNYSLGTTVNLTGQAVWASANVSRVAVSASGLATAVSNNPTATNVTATFGGKVGTASITPSAASLVSIAVTPPAPDLPAGLTQKFTAMGTYSDSTQANLTATAAWTSSDNLVATVAAGGNATSVAPGLATITATVGAISGTASFTVNGASLQSITVSAAVGSLPAGVKQQYAATGYFSNGASLDITGNVAWSSSNAVAATVAAGGLATTAAPGSTNITATLGAVNNSAPLTVTTATLVSVAVSPAAPAILASTTQQFTALGTYTDAQVVDISNVATWASATPATATIAAGGLATSAYKGNGTAGNFATTAISATHQAISSAASGQNATLRVNGLVTEGTAAAPVDITGLTPYAGQCYNNWPRCYYAVTGLTPGQTYTIRLTGNSGANRLRIYSDLAGPTFTTRVCEYVGVGTEEEICTVTPVGTTLAIRTQGDLGGIAGTVYTINFQ